MHILDTDILTYLHAGHPRVIQRLRELDDPDIAITLITKIELLRGRFDYVLKAATGVELITRNVRHFRHVPGLTVVNWMD